MNATAPPLAPAAMAGSEPPAWREQLYAAAIGAAGWAEPLNRLRTWFRASACGLVTLPRGDEAEPSLLAETAAGTARALERALEQPAGAMSTAPDPHPAPGGDGYDLVEAGTFEGRPLLILRLQRGARTSALGLFRNRPEAGFGETEVDVLRGLVSEIARATRARRKVDDLDRSPGRIIDILSCISTPAGLVTGSGERVFWNDPARQMLAQARVGLGPEHVAWQAACREAVRTGRAVVSLEPGLQITLNPVRALGNDGRRLTGAYSRERLTATLAATDALPRAAGDPVAAFGLTVAEGEVLAALGRGLGVSAIADARASSIATVRQHLKNLRRKTGRRSLASLTALTHG